MSGYAEIESISLHKSATYTTQANAISERANHAIIGMICSSLAQSSLCKSFWMKANKTVISISIHVTQNNGKSSFEKLSGNRPSLSGFRPFGFPVLSIVDDVKRENREFNAERCIFWEKLELGNYRVYNTSYGHVRTAGISSFLRLLLQPEM